MTLDNDTRGWLLTCLSGIACMIGACFICVDILVRLFPGRRNFRIENNDPFLSCSLSLTAGVMLFSSLYQMLPSSKSALESSGRSSSASSWILIACFLGGAFGIQIFSSLVHRLMPSHAVGCDHTHSDDEETDLEGKPNKKQGSQSDHLANGHAAHYDSDHDSTKCCKYNDEVNEATPLLSHSEHISPNHQSTLPRRDTSPELTRSSAPFHKSKTNGNSRPPLQTRVTASVSHLLPGAIVRRPCDANGPCFGYSDPCSASCFKNVTWKVTRWTAPLKVVRDKISLPEDPSKPAIPADLTPIPTIIEEPPQPALPRSASLPITPTMNLPLETQNNNQDPHETHTDPPSHPDQPHQQQHHHHVPTNAFLSLSLQTSLAISLHKLPEGFITYATNHANPSLGFSVFLALAIHNTTEGFALALPIYLASHSRVRALLYSALLGALSQPLGAAVAALWLKLAERDRGGGNLEGAGEGVYGGMFALTGGIMASVAVSLLGESFALSHSKGMCMACVFLGMGILGVGAALTS